MSGRAPLTKEYTQIVPGCDADEDVVATIAVAEWSGTLTEAVYIPAVAITGADTDSRTINILNQGTDGATGDAVTMASLALEEGTDPAQYAETALTLSATAADLAVVEGDVITYQSLHVGLNGMDDLGGTIKITLTRS